jgi:hypothetical protein
VKFALMMYTDPAHTKAMSDEEVKAIVATHGEIVSKLEDSGEIVNGAGLNLPEDTTTLRLFEGKPVSSTGPVARDDEQVTAYYLLETADRERAEEIGASILSSHVTAVEVREVHDSTGLG